MTMFKKVFGSQIAATGEVQNQTDLPPEEMEQLPLAPRPRSQPLFAPVPQVLQTKEEENAARRAARAQEVQDRMDQRPSTASPITNTPSIPEQPPVSEPPSEERPAAVAPPPPPPRPAGRARTRLLGFSGAADEVAPDPMAGPSVATKTQKFPTGWIVIISGPGAGHHFSLFSGVSTIGRDAEQAIPLDFGDMTISRENHAAIAYDEEDNQFYIGHGGKSNIIRLNGKPVLSTETLSSGDTLRIGETVLRFAAFCGPDFNWVAAQND